MKPKIWITLSDANYKKYITKETEIKLKNIGEIIDSRNLDPQKEIEVLKEVNGIITCRGGFELTPDQIEKAENLKIIGVIGSSVKHVSPEKGMDKGITITNTGVGIGYSVAEFALGMMLTCLHRVYDSIESLQNGKWGEDIGIRKDLQGKNIGLIGLGNVGYCLVKLLNPFNVTIRVYDPYANKNEVEKLGVILTTKKDVIENSDIISLHCGMTEETYHMIDEKELSKMKPGVLLINTARGQLINEISLIEYIKSGKIIAALDVFEQEPLPENSVFRKKIKDCFSTPHKPGGTIDAFSREGSLVVEDFKLFFEGQKPINIITKEKLSRMT